jgi:hypothetical protein
MIALQATTPRQRATTLAQSSRLGFLGAWPFRSETPRL